MNYYVYAMDTEHGVIIDAIRCPNESSAKKAFVTVKGQGRKCYTCDSKKYGFSPDTAKISYWSGGYDYEDGVEKVGYFEPADFEFAAQQTKKRWGSSLFTVMFMQEVASILDEMAVNTPIDIANEVRAAAVTPKTNAADYSTQVQAEHNVPIEYETMHSAAKKEPDEMVVVDYDSDAYEKKVLANYEAGLLLKYADKVDEWHIISKRKYSGKGFADIARTELGRQVKSKKRQNYKQADVDNLARNIERKIKAHREKLGITENE